MTIPSEFSVDTDFAYELVREMAPRFTSVYAGTEAEHEFAEYIRARFETLGIRCDVLRFDGLVSHPGQGSLRVVEADGALSAPIDCQVFAQSEPAHELEAEVVFLEAGSAEDYLTHDVTGKIVLVNLSYSPPRPEKARLARANGAAGMLMVNWGADTDRSIPKGTVKSLWGNPTRSTIDEMTTLPAVGISRPDGLELIKRATGPEKLVVRLNAEVDRKWCELHMPVAWVGEGPESEREFVMAGSHFDNWGAGVTDNLGGNAAMIAMAASLHAQREHLVRDVVFPFWTGHETGIMIGSAWYADRYWDLLRDRCVAYFSVAQLGLSGYSLWTSHSAGELRQLVRTVRTPEQYVIDRPEKTGDQSFYGIGIPAMDCRTGPTDEERAAGHGGILGWWYHSDNDTVDKLDPQTFASDTARIGGYLHEIAASRILPYRVSDAADEFRHRLSEIGEVVDPGALAAIGIDFGALGDRCEALFNLAQTFDSLTASKSVADDPELVGIVNEAMKSFSRATVPVRYSATSTYEQDSYGQTRLAHTLPELHVFGEFSAETDPSTRRLMIPEVFRARNRLSDAIAKAETVLSAAVDRLSRGVE